MYEETGYGQHCGVDLHFNVNDTEGYVFFTTGPQHLTFVSFVEKLEGFRVLSDTTSRFREREPYEISTIGTISRRFSKYKNPTVGVVYESDGKSHLRLFASDGSSTLAEPDHLSISRPSILAFLSLKDFILLSNREILFYSYYASKPSMTHRLPSIDCVSMLLSL